MNQVGSRVLCELNGKLLLSSISKQKRGHSYRLPRGEMKKKIAPLIVHDFLTLRVNLQRHRLVEFGKSPQKYKNA